MFGDLFACFVRVLIGSRAFGGLLVTNQLSHKHSFLSTTVNCIVQLISLYDLRFCWLVLLSLSSRFVPFCCYSRMGDPSLSGIEFVCCYYRPCVASGLCTQLSTSIWLPDTKREPELCQRCCFVVCCPCRYSLLACASPALLYAGCGDLVTGLAWCFSCGTCCGGVAKKSPSDPMVNSGACCWYRAAIPPIRNLSEVVDGRLAYDVRTLCDCCCSLCCVGASTAGFVDMGGMKRWDRPHNAYYFVKKPTVGPATRDATRNDEVLQTNNFMLSNAPPLGV